MICVDNIPAIQVLERAQGYLRLSNGRAITGFAHEYKRHGTTTLFTALGILKGKIRTFHKKRRCRREFIDFMNETIRDVPSHQEAHVILDNLRTHKPKNDKWLTRYKNVHFHYTQIHASWLNQAEIWFSILQRKPRHGAIFASVRQLREHVDALVETYNENAQPFEWQKINVKNKCLRVSS